MQNYRLIYASTHNGVSFDTIDRIMSASHRNNARHNISGALVISERYFLQVLEGARATVAERFACIMKDPRHSAIQIISARDTDSRLFADWTMRQVITMSIREKVIAPYLTDFEFIPTELTESQVIELCRTLSGNNFYAEAA